MRKTIKNLLSTLGAISLISGLFISIPSFINENYFGFGTSFFLVIIGAVLLSIAYGD